jgi:hypothetical protein
MTGNATDEVAEGQGERRKKKKETSEEIDGGNLAS